MEKRRKRRGEREIRVRGEKKEGRFKGKGSEERREKRGKVRKEN